MNNEEWGHSITDIADLVRFFGDHAEEIKFQWSFGGNAWYYTNMYKSPNERIKSLIQFMRNIQQEELEDTDDE